MGPKKGRGPPGPPKNQTNFTTSEQAPTTTVSVSSQREAVPSSVVRSANKNFPDERRGTIGRGRGQPRPGLPPKSEQAPATVATPGSVSSQRALVPSSVGASLVRPANENFPEQRRGTLGRRIPLVTNYFAVDIPHGSVYHYDIEISICKEQNGQVVMPKKPTGPTVKKSFDKAIFRQIIHRCKDQYRKLFNGLYPAYDGYKNIITRKPLPINKPETLLVNLLEGEREVKYWVVIKPVKKEYYNCEINLEPMHEAVLGRTSNIPQECIMALDIILRHGPALRYVPVGRSFFEKPRSQDEVPLGPGKAIWFGYYQSLRPGWKPLPSSTVFYLNIDRSATAFYKDMPVIDYIFSVLNIDKRRPPDFFSPQIINQAKKKLKGIKIQVTHLPYPRRYTVKGMTSERAAKVTFPMDGKDVYVTEFFRTKHNRIIKYQNYPCLIVGNNGYVPLEVCKIVDCQPARGKLDQEKEQDKMVKATAIPPKARFDEIKNAILDVCNENREVLREFDMSISTDPKKLEGRVLAAPHVLYGNEDKANVRDGQWEMRGKSFVKGTSIEQWAMLSLCGCSRQDMKKFALELYKSGRNSGVNFYEPVLTIAEDLNSYTQIEEHLTRIKNENPNLQMALVVIKPNSPSYKDVKKISETDLGLITQCVTDINLKKCIENPHGGNKFGFRFFMNLCQKINAKMGGTNTSLTKEEKPTIFKKPIMIVGADVTHPRSDDRDKFSIAAVVGSIDSYPSRYCAAVELQRSETENRAREETIVKLEVMIKKLLKKFLECTNGHFPEKIIYYRDGVSEGQFLPVRDYELVQIRNACESFQNAKFRPEITFIVVQKRHHTKFKPEDFRDGAGKFGNVPAGTTVDTEITQPGHFNFYLCSHVAIQGTSRPGHYNVLYDDSDFTADDLQKLTFYLCHTYTRCTKSISIPPPVMYADLVAYRAKLYVDSVVERRNHSASSQSSDSRDVFLSDEIVNSIILKDAIKDSMYYV